MAKKKNPPRKSLFVSLPLAVFLALKLNSQTRSKKLVELLQKYALGVSYKKVLTIDVNFAQAIADQTRNNADIVCPTNFASAHFHSSSTVSFITEAWVGPGMSTNQHIESGSRHPATFIYLVYLWAELLSANFR